MFQGIIRKSCLACAAIVLIAAHAADAQGTRDAVIHLHKAGDTVSVRNATVTVDHVIEAGKTDADGKVVIPDLEDGGHIIEAGAAGYQSIFDNFVSGPDVRQPIEIEMEALIIRPDVLKGPKTGLQFADFDRRRARGEGTFFTRAQLDSATGRPLANVLKVNLGASLVTEQGSEHLVSSDPPANASSPCYAAVVRDGVRIYPFEGARPPDLEKLFAEKFAGVEFYRRAALVPAELHEAAACGALVLWSRSAVR